MNRDFRQYSITWYYIFQVCFKKRGLIKDDIFDKKEWSFELGNTLAEFILKYIDDHVNFDAGDFKEKNVKKIGQKAPYIFNRIGEIDHNAKENRKYAKYCKYLSDTFSDITTKINKGGFFEEFDLNKDKVEPLLLYSEIKDFEIISSAFYDSFHDENMLPKFYIERVKYFEKQHGKENELFLLDFERLPSRWVIDPARIALKKTQSTNNNKFGSTQNSDTKSDSKKLVHTKTDEAPIYPIRIPVVYLKKPVKWFNLLPIPDEGELVFDENGNCVYNNDGRSMPIKKDTIKKDVKTFANPRDLEPLWVEVTYLDGEKPQTAYFAEPQDDAYKLKLADPGRLLKLFNTKKKTEVSG